MTLGFEESLLILLTLMLTGSLVSVKTKGILSLQLVFGLGLILFFSAGWITAETVKLSKLNDIGILAFTVLMIHTGTQVDFMAIWKHRVLTLYLFLGMTCVVVGVGGILYLLGYPLVFTLFSTVLMGSGATAAIGSNMLSGAYPEISVLPWMLFMIQSLMGAPLFNWALKMTVQKMPVMDIGIQVGHAQSTQENKTKRGIQLPQIYKSPVYYLSMLLLLAVINKWLFLIVFKQFGIHPSLTALLIGVLASGIGVIEREPLNKADMMGLLMLGLISLMALTFSQVSLDQFVKAIPAVLVISLSSVLIIIVFAFVFSKYFRMQPFHGLMLISSCLIGFPGVMPLFINSIDQRGMTPEKKGYIAGRLSESIVWSNRILYSIGSIVFLNVVWWII